MLKKYKILLIITSVIILLPAVAGLIMWNDLPDSMATHFGINGNADGYSSKAFAVIGLPLIILGLHLLCFFITRLDPKKRNIHDKAMVLVLWVCPSVSVICSLATYSHALDIPIPFVTIIIVFMGILFAVIGNYLPKCKQNYTVGIKVPWTLADEEIWNKTHRFAGFLWIIGGILILATAFLQSFVIFISITMLMVIVPFVYSIVIYKKKNK